MPYITQRDRKILDGGGMPVSAGELNYAITKMVLRWIGPKPDYATYAAAVGILETLKLELYRRAVAPYEDGKKETNGDVF